MEDSSLIIFKIFSLKKIEQKFLQFSVPSTYMVVEPQFVDGNMELNSGRNFLTG